MGWGYHQLEIGEETEERYSKPTKASTAWRESISDQHMSGIFHNGMRKALAGLPGVVTIHDNIAVWH